LTDWRSREWLTTPDEIARVLPRLGHRTGRFIALDVLDPDLALALAKHWTRIESTLDVVATDDTRRLRVLRCPACQGRWTEDSISSGHAELVYGYPVHTGDPVARVLRRW
jgi:hypothetical protein